jgi:hypothetical protein
MTTKIVAQIGVQILLHGTEQMGLEVNCRVVFRRCSVRISAGAPAIPTDVSAGFLSPFRQKPA